MNFFKIENNQIILVETNEKNITRSDEVYNFLKSNNLIKFEYKNVDFQYNYDLIKQQDCIDILCKNEYDEWEEFLTIYAQKGE